MLLCSLLALAQTVDVHTDPPMWFPWNPANPWVNLVAAGRLGPDLLLRARTGTGSNLPGTGTDAFKDSLWVFDGTVAGTVPIAQVGETAPEAFLSTHESAGLPNGDEIVLL